MTNGNRIRQARDIAGFSQTELADKLTISQSAIAQIEAGSIQPSPEVLEAIAVNTGYPISFFRQPDPPEFPLGSLLFRARASLASRERTRAQRRGQRVLELGETLMAKVVPIPVQLPRCAGDPRESARLTRSVLGVSPESPIPNLVNLLERNGVWVLAVPERLADCDAFSLWAGTAERRPVIVFSANAPGDRLRYSVAHELGHLVMHMSPMKPAREIEAEANQFAGEFLLPEAAMRQEIITPVALVGIAQLKPRWGVSIQSLIVRAKELNIVTERQYRYLFQQLSARGWRLKEPDELCVPIEKPRSIRKMAEVIYGYPIDYEKLVKDFPTTTQEAERIISAFADRSEYERPQRSKTTPLRVLNFTRKV